MSSMMTVHWAGWMPPVAAHAVLCAARAVHAGLCLHTAPRLRPAGCRCCCARALMHAVHAWRRYQRATGARMHGRHPRRWLGRGAGWGAASCCAASAISCCALRLFWGGSPPLPLPVHRAACCAALCAGAPRHPPCLGCCAVLCLVSALAHRSGLRGAPLQVGMAPQQLLQTSQAHRQQPGGCWTGCLPPAALPHMRL